MAEKNRRTRNAFRKFERMMTRVILGTLAVFILMLAASAGGIGWLRWMLSITVMLVSSLSCALLVLKQEHRRRRSCWMLASFVSFLA